MGYAAVMQEVSDFIDSELENQFGEDFDEAVADKLCGHYAGVVDGYAIIDGIEPGTDVWELRGEDEDTGIEITASDIEELAGK